MKNKRTAEEKELHRRIHKEAIKEFYSNTNQLDGTDDNEVLREIEKRFEEERKKLKTKQ